MAVNHDVVASIPAGAGDLVRKDLLRQLLVQRSAYVLADSEDSRELVALDPDFGVKILSIIYKGMIFNLDPLDATTAHDGISCLLSFEGLRYKVVSLPFPSYVISKSITDPPVSPAPAISDSYLIFSASSGDWALQTGNIAIFTARGWEFVIPRIGQFVYVSDEAGYYHLDENGDWINGVGAAALSAASVKISNLIGSGKNLRIAVVNQTTNDPPASPSMGDAYVIGSSPTGDWAGNAKSIAIWEGFSWAKYAPAKGWLIYDIAQDADFKFSGTTWQTASGFAIIASFRVSGFNGSQIPGTSSSVDTAADTVTWNTNHGLVTGQIVKFVSFAPGGLTTNVPYYVRAISATVFALYIKALDAASDVNRINLTSTSSGSVIFTMVGITIDSNFGASLIEIVGGNTKRIRVVYSQAFPDTKYVILPMGVSIIAGSTITHVGPPQPVIKLVSEVTFEVGLNLTGSTPANFNWNDMSSSDTLQFQLAVLRSS